MNFYFIRIFIFTILASLVECVLSEKPKVSGKQTVIEGEIFNFTCCAKTIDYRFKIYVNEMENGKPIFYSTSANEDVLLNNQFFKSYSREGACRVLTSLPASKSATYICVISNKTNSFRANHRVNVTAATENTTVIAPPTNRTSPTPMAPGTIVIISLSSILLLVLLIVIIWKYKIFTCCEITIWHYRKVRGITKPAPGTGGEPETEELLDKKCSNTNNAAPVTEDDTDAAGGSREMPRNDRGGSNDAQSVTVNIDQTDGATAAPSCVENSENEKDAKIRNLENENCKLILELKEEKSARGKVEKDLDKVRKELQNMRGEMEEVEKENKQLQERNAKLVAGQQKDAEEKKRLEDRLQQLEKDTVKFKTLEEELLKRDASLSCELKERNDNISMMAREIEKLKSAQCKTDADVHAMKEA